MLSLILASASPRRQELLGKVVSYFQTVVSTVEETGSATLPEWELVPLPLNSPFYVPTDDDPRLWAWRKGIDALSSLSLEKRHKCVVLAADTVVVAPGELLQKPRDLNDARRMLTLLRGRDHFVVTGFALLGYDGEAVRTFVVGAVLTRVTMKAFSDVELEGYVATGEQMDKAGAYALQGMGGRLVERVEGCVTNVIGLPLCEARRALEALGVELLPFPAGGYCLFCPR